MNKINRYSKFLALILVFSCAFCQLAFAAPSLSEGAIKTSVQNSVISFDVSDFFTEDPATSSIVITELPDPELGNLLLNGEEVMIFQTISKKDIENLKFVPVKDTPEKRISALNPSPRKASPRKAARYP